jgi:hypothetical protein
MKPQFLAMSVALEDQGETVPIRGAIKISRVLWSLANARESFSPDFWPEPKAESTLSAHLATELEAEGSFDDVFLSPDVEDSKEWALVGSRLDSSA